VQGLVQEYRTAVLLLAVLEARHVDHDWYLVDAITLYLFTRQQYLLLTVLESRPLDHFWYLVDAAVTVITSFHTVKGIWITRFCNVPLEGTPEGFPSREGVESASQAQYLKYYNTLFTFWGLVSIVKLVRNVNLLTHLPFPTKFCFSIKQKFVFNPPVITLFVVINRKRTAYLLVHCGIADKIQYGKFCSSIFAVCKMRTKFSLVDIA
jgi:hypothetical protein